MTIPTPDPTLGTGGSIGKYFSVVSVVPSVVFALWVFLVFASLGPSGHPNLATLRENATEPKYFALALVLALVVAILGHPLQFAMVQALEGYWGLGRLGVKLRVHLVQRHLRRLALAVDVRERAQADYKALCDRAGGNQLEYLTTVTQGEPRKLAFPVEAEQLVKHRVLMDEAAWIEAQYPDDPADLLPTRLGNRLRRHELRAGRAIHLPVGTWATHIGMVAKAEHTGYVGDQRTAMDLAVRTAWSMAGATLVTFAALWNTGWAALLTLVPLLAAYLSYGGAVVASGSYGAALQAWVDLNRFRLYDELHLAHPASSEAERAANRLLGDLFDGEDEFQVLHREERRPEGQPPV